jgi:hypothetical protein
MKPNDIICPTCGEVCGKRYPSTFEDPGFCEGIGENFVLDMVWHCSQNCLDQANYEKSLPTEPSHRECSSCMATIPHPGDSLCKAREVRKQCVCGHTWIGTIQDENCPRCNPNDAGEGSSLPPKYDTPEPRPAWLDSPLAPTDQQMKDYRESFLLHPVDLLAGRIRGEGYHTRIESYREAAIRLYDQDAHTTAEYAKEVVLHAVTKHELKQAQDWMAENS